MAIEQPSLKISLSAAADLSLDQFKAVKVSGSMQANLAALGDPVVGILQNKPMAGEAAEITSLGIAKAKAGAAISAGALVSADAAGLLMTATPSTTDTSDAGAVGDPLIGSHVLGVALEAAANANEIISVLLMPMGAVPTTNA